MQKKTDRPVNYLGEQMKREEKNAASRQKILTAALEEFSRKGYEGASLSTLCAEKEISKGLIYHYFSGKEELYLLCVGQCFEAFTACLAQAAEALHGSAREKLGDYFDARLRFFAENPLYLGIFADAVFNTPSALGEQISRLRADFDRLNLSVLSGLLKSQPLRPGLSPEGVAEDFRAYMDYFNLRFRAAVRSGQPVKNILIEHEEKCCRQLDILLYGVWEKNEE